MKKKYLSTVEAAKVLGISRIAVFKRIQKGQLPAEKIGGVYAIDPVVLGLGGGEPSKKIKRKISRAIDRVFKEYGVALKKLGNE